MLKFEIIISLAMCTSGVIMTENNVSETPGTQQSQRSDLRSPLIVEKIPCEDSKKTFFGYAKNLSSGGLFISTVNPRRPGERFTIELTLPTPEKPTIQSACEVVWCRHYERKQPYEPGMGLKFCGLSMENQAEIERWVKQQSTSSTE
jgi:uncharacterized protein (TIGR02266 family)